MKFSSSIAVNIIQWLVSEKNLLDTETPTLVLSAGVGSISKDWECYFICRSF